MAHPTAPNRASTPAGAATAEQLPCACCRAEIAPGEARVCASCGQTVCPACTRWYGHFMLVCEDCKIASW